jgi:Rrf2 family protein
MKLINRDSDYALKALLAVARRRAGETTAVSELTEKLGIPRPYLRKILQTLARSGIVVSRKGKGGGFVLGRRPEAIGLADVLRVFQGEIGFRDCLFRKEICRDFQTCPLRQTLGRLEDRFLEELKSVSIATLLEEGQTARRVGEARDGKGCLPRKRPAGQRRNPRR